MATASYARNLKKVFAILLLSVFVFNLIGYKCWFVIKAMQVTQLSSATLNAPAYDESKLMVIKVPLSLPYSNNWTAFEQYNGSIEIEGHHYEYVKRKVSNDTLILLCLPNTEKDKLEQARISFEKLANGETNRNDKNSSLPVLLKLLATHYFNQHHFTFTFPLFENCGYTPVANKPLVNGVTTRTWQPPDNSPI